MPDRVVDHLPPDAVAAFVDGSATPDERARAVAHFARCPACREELREVHRMVRDRRRRRLTIVVPLAAAAAAALFVLRPVGTPAGNSALIERSAPVVARFAVVAPTPTAPVASDSVVFVWSRAGDGANYRVTLVTEDGTTVWSGTTSDTSAMVPDSVALAPDRDWFWYVDALFPDGRSSTTGIHRMRTRP